MSISERTRERVDSELDRLQEQYGPFDVESQTVENESDFFEYGVELAERGWMGDAGGWITDDAGRVLLIRHESAQTSGRCPVAVTNPVRGSTTRSTERFERKRASSANSLLSGE